MDLSFYIFLETENGWWKEVEKVVKANIIGLAATLLKWAQTNYTISDIFNPGYASFGTHVSGNKLVTSCELFPTAKIVLEEPIEEMFLKDQMGKTYVSIVGYSRMLADYEEYLNMGGCFSVLCIFF